MATSTIAELQVLDRIMHLLEEQSVSRLAEDDEAFCSFVEDLYAKLDNRVLSITSH